MKLPLRVTATRDDGSALLERLDALIEAQHQTNALLERLIDQHSSPPGGRVEPSATARPRRRPSGTGPPSPGGTKRSPGLHEEIEAVLREVGHPLPATQIADRIRQRGRYTPPRSAKPLSASTVNSRVANPTYRSRFVRGEDGIWLAAEVAEEPTRVGSA